MQAVNQLSGEERALARQRFQLLEAHLAGQKDLQSISESAGVSVRTLQRWVVGYKQAGLAGLFKLIGMPGIEKRIARFPQLYSRIGFVHEFRPLGDVEMQEILERRWTPAGVRLPEGTLTPEVIARLIRITSGNLRLLTRLLIQVERVLRVNHASQVSVQIVEAARDSLVIGQA